MQNASKACEAHVAGLSLEVDLDLSTLLANQTQAKTHSETHFDIAQSDLRAAVTKDFDPTRGEDSQISATALDDAITDPMELKQDGKSGARPIDCTSSSEVSEVLFADDFHIKASAGEDEAESETIPDGVVDSDEDSHVGNDQLPAIFNCQLTNGCRESVRPSSATSSPSSASPKTAEERSCRCQNGYDDSRGASPQLLLATLHYKSVGTSTGEHAGSEDRGCQCFPEDFLSDEQDLHGNDTPAPPAGQQVHDELPVGGGKAASPSVCCRQSVALCVGMSKMDVIKMRQDLLKAQDKIQSLDTTLKKMRAEKLDLLGQMKNLYNTLESKEENLNAFVKNFETKISQCNDLISRLISEKTHLERTNQATEMKLQNALDQCVSLNLDLDLKTQVIEQLNLQLESSQVSRSDSNLSSVKVTGVAMETSFPRSSTDDDVEKSQDLQLSSRLGEGHSLEKALNDVETRDPSVSAGKEVKSSPSLSEVLRVPIVQWKANHVLTWLEQDLNMGYYRQQCKENVKSGKVLLTMSDQELDSAFGLQSPIHRKKLRIAIDHLDNPSLKKYPLADQLSTAWISGEWLPSLGLPQFGPVFEAQLVDGRILDYITPKELEKNFTMISRTHVSSLMAGVQLLRMFDFDRKKLEEQREAAKKRKNGCVMWTNADVIRWLEDIDLQEYTRNLKSSGIHGALMVLDEKFTPNQLANEMGLPSSKSYLFRHLSQEYNDIVAPARSSTCGSFLLHGDHRTRTLSRASSSSSSAKNRRDDLFSTSLSFKGSLGRAFGKKAKKEMIQVIPTSEPVRMPADLLSIFDSPTPRNHLRLQNNNNNVNSNNINDDGSSIIINNSSSIINNPCVISSSSLSAFSSLQSLPVTVQSTSMTEVVVPSTLATLTPREGEGEANGGGGDGQPATTPTTTTPTTIPTITASPLSENSKSHKSKTPKSKSHYFSLRAFSASSRLKSSAK